MVALEHGIQGGVEGVRRGATGGGFANAKLIIIRLITMVVGAEGGIILHTLDQLKLLNEELTQLNLGLRPYAQYLLHYKFQTQKVPRKVRCRKLC